MQNEIIINAELGETRIALLERGQFAELHIERSRDKSVVGNVVKGRVMRVLPGMQAAFVDIGLEKAAFLYVGDYFESKLETGDTEGEPGSRGKGGRGGRGGGRNSRSAPPRIDTVLHEGKEIVVQIAKEPIGTKGARITSSISIPGRHLVLTPWSRRVGVSRRIGSDRERRRLREIVERLRPQNLGFIIRTAGDGVREADLQADIRYLATVWAAVQKRHEEQQAPAVLYSEHDLPLRIVRDLAGHETKRISADSKEVYDSIQNFVDRFVADPKPNVEHYQDTNPIFERFELEGQIHANLERKVWLKSGGSLVVDKSEALTAIDVNTGRFVGKRDLEETVLKTNLEAVAEVVHQLRFRNLGGLIIIDLIDMESAGNREKVYRALQEALRADKARTNILKISELGLVEMTRKRTRENLVQTLCEPCSYCEGRAYVLSPESVSFRVLRELRKHIPRLGGRSVAVTVNPHVAEKLLTEGKAALAKVSEEIGKPVEVRARPGLHQELYELTVLEAGPPAEISLPWLRDLHPDSEEAKAKAKKEAEAEKAAQIEARAAKADAKAEAKSTEEDSPQDGDESTSTSSRRRTRGGRGRSRNGRSRRSESDEDTEVETESGAIADENGSSATPESKKVANTESADAEPAAEGDTPRRRRSRRRSSSSSTSTSTTRSSETSEEGTSSDAPTRRDIGVASAGSATSAVAQGESKVAAEEKSAPEPKSADSQAGADRSRQEAPRVTPTLKPFSRSKSQSPSEPREAPESSSASVSGTASEAAPRGARRTRRVEE